MQDKNAGR